jgi:aminoglycoside 6'-N-acetyltransferase
MGVQVAERVSLEAFRPDRHGQMLAAWVQAPHVARWWGEPATQLEAALRRPVGGGDALIVADGTPVGYIRWERAAREELDAAGLSELPAGTVGIDIAIGEAHCLGRGIGSRALAKVVERITAGREVPAIIMATSVDNAGAIRAFEKAGFQRRRTFEDGEYGVMWLLQWERAVIRPT